MDLLNPSRLKIEKFAWLAQGTLLLVAAVYSTIWLIFLGLQSPDACSSVRNLPMPRLDYLQIGKGPFAILPKNVSPELEPIVQELVLVGKNTRPDGEAKSMICLGLKTSGSRKELVSGQKVHLAQKDGKYEFSEKETGLALLPLSLSGSEVLLQIDAASGIKEEIVLTPSPLFQRTLDEESYVQCLKKAALWVPDLFLNQWGGEEYRDLSSKHKIEIEGKVHFVAVGDILWWDGNQWSNGAPMLEETPLAKVLSLTPQGLKIEIWDPSGYNSSSVSMPLQQGSRAPVKVEEMISSVRPR
ncbi:MAG: hypothetical protein ACRENF_03920, partial [Thermodesulfobacteriota bacterium]